MADGSLIFDTKVDESGFKRGVDDLNRQARGLGDQMDKTGKGGGLSFMELAKGTFVGQAAMQALSSAVGILKDHLGDAIARYDTLNNFPKVMQNLGISTEDSAAAMKKLSDGLQNVPTTLDSAASAVQRFTSNNGDVNKSTDYFLALNNAILAGGQSTEIQSSALEQLSQAYSKGRMDMMEWRSLQQAMPAQLNQIAQAMGMTADELGEGLRNGTVSMDDFMDTIVNLNKKGVGEFASFEKQAEGAVGGIGTSFANMKTAITRGMADSMASIDEALKKANLPTIGEMLQNIGKGISDVFKKVADALKGVDLSGFGSVFKDIGSIISSTFSVVGSLASFALPLLANAFKVISPYIHMVASAFKIVATVIKTLVSTIASILLPIVTIIGTTFAKIKDKISKPFNDAHDLVKKAMNKIKKIFPLKIGKIFSSLKLPHISVSGGKAPFGIAGKGSLPKFNIKWNDKAVNNPYMFSGATIFGAGETKDEVLYGRANLMRDIREASGGNTNMNVESVISGLIEALSRVSLINNLNVDGRNAATVMAPFLKPELNKIDARNNRKLGYV